MHGALSKWDTRVAPTLALVRTTELLKPAYWVLGNNLSIFPLVMPDKLFIYGKHSSETVNGGQVEWRRYRRILQDLCNSMKVEEGSTEINNARVDEVSLKLSSPQTFWDEHKGRLPCLYKLSLSVFAFCPSAAEVERSFKKLRAILPKDHTRDCINEQSLRREMFFSFNKEKLSLFK